MNAQQIRQKLIQAGVKNLKDFGYPSVNEQNILTDILYSCFFKSMLTDNLGKACGVVDGVINALIAELNKNV